MPSPATPHLRPPLTIFVVLILLMAVNVAQSWIGIGPWHVPVTLAIACVAAAIVLWFSMEIRRQTGALLLYAAAGFVWLLIMFTLGLSDYLTR